MKTLLYSTIALFGLGLYACSQPAEDSSKKTDKVEATPEKAPAADSKPASVTRSAMVEVSGVGGLMTKGEVTFTDIDGRTTMKAYIKGLTQGVHAIHIHEKGDCSSEDGKSAGGHWNPTGEDHGKWGVAPFHRGDIGNMSVDKNGIGEISLTTELWCVGCGDPKRDVVGKSIIVHAGVDDCTSQPSGAAGARVGCGVIEFP